MENTRAAGTTKHSHIKHGGVCSNAEGKYLSRYLCLSHMSQCPHHELLTITHGVGRSGRVAGWAERETSCMEAPLLVFRTLPLSWAATPPPSPTDIPPQRDVGRVCQPQGRSVPGPVALISTPESLLFPPRKMPLRVRGMGFLILGF